MNAIDQHANKISELADELWEKTVLFCNKVLHHSRTYGFTLMDIPDPDVHKICDSLETVVLPVLSKIVDRPELADEDHIKIANVRQYILHIQNIVQAIHQDDEAAFIDAVNALENESFLHVAKN
ncbi:MULTISPECIES: hypothetical protein [Spongiibacter]|uniref:hypothetical protein n=1 Tax=Spongiibacter TaxID=630749 RepID=UPI0003B60D3F|nr:MULTISPECIES: hypothetical protein [Spongiibacter]MBM7423831.1 hypothetical protein [Spongiibacter marinus]